MKRIIVADDDPAIQDAMEIILKRLGFLPEIHPTAEKLFANDFAEPELFIIDWQLQNVNGLDVCRFLKSRADVHTPVIIFSASYRADQLAQFAGADAFLEKPFTNDVLMQLINRLLQQYADHSFCRE